MRYKIKTLLLLVIFVFSFVLSSPAQYANLVGKWVRINAPNYERYLGVALDEQTCDQLIALLGYGQEREFRRFLKSFKILKVKDKTAALVKDVYVFEGKAKVVLLSGLYRGASGWIPIEWLDGNKEFISISSKKY